MEAARERLAKFVLRGEGGVVRKWRGRTAQVLVSKSHLGFTVDFFTQKHGVNSQFESRRINSLDSRECQTTTTLERL